MDSVEAQLAHIRSTIEEAIERVNVLDKRMTEGKDSSDDDQMLISRSMDDGDLISRAEKYLNWGRLKSRILDSGNGLFANSCWNMCLDIFICDLKDQRITVSSIAHSSGIPMTTAMRYINVMVEQGLLHKTPNSADNRMIFVSVSEDCSEKIRELLMSAPF